MSAGAAALAADRRARLAAKASKPQAQVSKLAVAAPIEETPKGEIARRASASQPSSFATTTTTRTQEGDAAQPVAAAAPATAGGYNPAHYPAYNDDMDDLDATMYIDEGVNALQLSRKAPATQQPSQSKVAVQKPAPSVAISPTAASSRPQPLALSSPKQQQSPPPNPLDEVQSFDAPMPILSPRIIPTATLSARDTDEPDSPVHGIRSGGVLTLDSAAEERRLDKERRRKAREHARAQGLQVDDSEDEEESELEGQQQQQQAAAAAAAAAGWVDPQTRLAQGDRDLRLPQHQSNGYDAYDTQESPSNPEYQTRDQQMDDEEQQYYLRKQQQQAQQQQQQQAASASASTAAAAPASDDPREQAYQQQLRLQAEYNQLIQQKAAAGQLSADDQRLAALRSKRPPLLLDWATVDAREFFTSAVPRGGWVQCRLIKRSGGSFAAFLHPRYEFYTEEHQGGMFLATARKSSKTKPNYHIACEKFAKGEDRAIEKSSPAYVGKVAATLSRSDYIVYDAGFNPSKSNDQATSHCKTRREEIGHISYKPHLSGKTPRKLAVLFPILFDGSHRDAHIAKEFANEFLSQSSAYQHLWRQLQEAQQRARVPRAWSCLLNKPPRYHADTGQYVLDFCGRAPQVSVKNFQLVYPEEPDEVLFQLGRLDDDNFSVDFRYPLAPEQAFAIALSSLDYKWTVD